MRMFWESTWVGKRQLFTFPLASVVAATHEDASRIAEEHGLRDTDAKMWLALDSAEAQHRLGVWGDVRAQERIQRGDGYPHTEKAP